MKGPRKFAGAAAVTTCLAIAGCASLDGDAPAFRPDPFAIEQGREIAVFHCATCHQIGPTGASPSLMAPPFHSLRISYNRLAFHKAIEASEDVHRMPGYDLGRDEVDDLIAYLRSVRSQP